MMVNRSFNDYRLLDYLRFTNCGSQCEQADSCVSLWCNYVCHDDISFGARLVVLLPHIASPVVDSHKPPMWITILSARLPKAQHSCTEKSRYSATALKPWWYSIHIRSECSIWRKSQTSIDRNVRSKETTLLREEEQQDASGKHRGLRCQLYILMPHREQYTNDYGIPLLSRVNFVQQSVHTRNLLTRGGYTLSNVLQAQFL